MKNSIFNRKKSTEIGKKKKKASGEKCMELYDKLFLQNILKWFCAKLFPYYKQTIGYLKIKMCVLHTHLYTQHTHLNTQREREREKRNGKYCSSRFAVQLIISIRSINSKELYDRFIYQFVFLTEILNKCINKILFSFFHSISALASCPY